MRKIVAALAVSLAPAAIAVGTVILAPKANAGCQSIVVLGGWRETCDGPIRPDGTWDRCDSGGFGAFGGGGHCFPMGGHLGVPPGQQPGHIYP